MDEKKATVLRERFNHLLQENARLANYTTIGVGGCVDFLFVARDAGQLKDIMLALWELKIPVKVLGSGSNVLVSDNGLQGAVVINHAHNIKIHTNQNPMNIWAESGALLSVVGRQAAVRGLSGMEWAATIPGTVGGAVYGNAGAFGKDTSCNLLEAEVLIRDGSIEKWGCKEMGYSYRASAIKRNQNESVILTTTFVVEAGERKAIENRITEFRERRIRNQPPGMSFGSTFRNPPEKKAGQLIEAVNLKGKQIGGAVISSQHANFIINTGGATASDVYQLMRLAFDEVKNRFNISLIPEIEFLGDWREDISMFINASHTASEVE